jgi:hypothetical protein
MPYIELLAESSLVFTGFTALLFALGESEGPRGMFKAWSIVAQGFIVFGMSLLPLLVFQLGPDERTLWRFASASAFVVTLAFLVSIPRISARLTRHGHPPEAPRMLWWAFGTSTLGCCLLLANFIGWPLAPSSFLYGAGLTLFLAVGISGVVAKFWILLAEFTRQSRSFN